MRKILDKMFANKKLSLLIPTAIALLMYLLFVLFGTTEDKTDMIIMTPIASVFWFFGVFFVIFIQVKNPSCPEWFLNIFEFLSTTLFGIYAIVDIASFLFDRFQNFDYGLCLGLVTYSAVSWAHSKRPNN